jgi:hypothetical protein
MVGTFIVAAIVAMHEPASSLRQDAASRVAAVADPPATPSPAPDPCAAHRGLFCGRIRIVPADPDARRIWYLRAASEIADALISSAAERTLATSRWSSVATEHGIYATRWRMVQGAASSQEATGFYRIFAGRSGAIGLGGYLLGFALWDATEGVGAHVVEHFGLRTGDLVADGALAHMDGAASWHATAWLVKDQRLMHVCLVAVSYPGAPPMRSVTGCPNLWVEDLTHQP